MMDAVPTKGSWYSYGDHRFVAGFSREAIYRRDDFHQQIHERDRDNYACYRNDSWKRRNFCNPVCDTPRSRWERDQCPGSKGDRSWSRGHDYRQRSRSPCVSSHSGSRRKHNYDSEHNHRRSSVVPSATVKVTGLSKRATAEDLYQILAEWGPLHNVQVIQERNSSSLGGIAFINFPSVVNAGMMMSALGYGGLVVDGAELRFEYSYKKIKSKNKQMRAKQSSQRRRRQRAIERDTINGPARLQRDEEKVLAEVVEEGKAEGSEQGGEVGESEVVEGEGEAEHSEEEGKVGDSEAEDVDEEAEGSEQGGEVGDSEADEVERDVEDSEVDGEAGDREADRMLNEEGEVIEKQ